MICLFRHGVLGAATAAGGVVQIGRIPQQGSFDRSRMNFHHRANDLVINAGLLQTEDSFTA